MKAQAAYLLGLLYALEGLLGRGLGVLEELDRVVAAARRQYGLVRMKGERRDLVRVVVERAYDRMVLGGRLLLHALAVLLLATTATHHVVHHGAFGQHALHVEYLDGGVHGAGGDHRAQLVEGGRATRRLVRRHVARLVLGRVHRRRYLVRLVVEVEAHFI